jgi:hypothetical protein
MHDVDHGKLNHSLKGVYAMSAKLRLLTILAIAITAMPAQCADDRAEEWPSQSRSIAAITRRAPNGIESPPVLVQYKEAYGVFFESRQDTQRFLEAVRYLPDGECYFCAVNRGGIIGNGHGDGGMLSAHQVAEWVTHPSLDPRDDERPLIEILQDLQSAIRRTEDGDQEFKDLTEAGTIEALGATYTNGHVPTVVVSVDLGANANASLDVKLVATQDHSTDSWITFYASVPKNDVGRAYQSMTTGDPGEPVSNAAGASGLERWIRDPERLAERNRVQQAAHTLCVMQGIYPAGSAPSGAPMIWSVTPTRGDA